MQVSLNKLLHLKDSPLKYISDPAFNHLSHTPQWRIAFSIPITANNYRILIRRSCIFHSVFFYHLKMIFTFEQTKHSTTINHLVDVAENRRLCNPSQLPHYRCLQANVYHIFKCIYLRLHICVGDCFFFFVTPSRQIKSALLKSPNAKKTAWHFLRKFKF